MTINLLTEHHLELLRLKGGSIGSSESTLVKMTHCWKSHVAAQILHAEQTNTRFFKQISSEILLTHLSLSPILWDTSKQ